VRFVRLVDTSNPALFSADADGYDLDAVKALHSSADKAGCRPDNNPPMAEPNGPYLGAVNTDIVFDGSGSYDPDLDPLTYAWDFGDGGTGTGVSPVHSYSEAGIYGVCLIVNDDYVDSAVACTYAVVYDPSAGFVTGGGWIDSPAGAVAPVENVVFFNGFETDTEGWFEPNRVMSGNNDIPSATGDYHAEAMDDFTRWGGYNSTFPAGGFITSVDIYLDMEAGYANDTRFDWTSAINAPDGNHRRDFIFNGGFYSDADGPGAGLNRFVFSASNNAPGWPKNPGRDPIAVTTTGWYTLQHHFYDNGAGVLAVDLSILDANGQVIHTWTLSDPTDFIGVTVGGNRYGWFATNGFPFLAIDNGLRKELATITGKATFGFVSKYRRGATIPEGNTEFQFKAGDLNFHSTSYEWLVVTGGNFAKFKGSGTINGQGDYKFQVWAGDSSPDTFRIKIWYEDGGSEVVVYDNGMNQPIGGGSIVVHTR
jgi:PKD repeat protein